MFRHDLLDVAAQLNIILFKDDHISIVVTLTFSPWSEIRNNNKTYLQMGVVSQFTDFLFNNSIIIICDDI